jgi:ligand-binding sensor domain-containing protein/signal transduction histidine kinase
MQKLRTLGFWLLACALGCGVSAADGLDGYTRHVWQAPDGLPEQTVQAFAQTPDGYLWIGTTGGLLRFDGVHFTVFDRQNTPNLHENSVFCLMVAKDGTLWIGTEGGGIVSYAAGEFRIWVALDGQSNDFVRVMMQDSDGTIWAGTDGGLLRLAGDRFVRIDHTPAFPAISVHSIYRDRAGQLWVGGSRLVRMNGDAATDYSLGAEASQNEVKSILQTSDGTLWVGTVAGLNRTRPGRDRLQRVSGITSTVRVLRQTPDGVLWIGTIGQGLFTFDGSNLAQSTAPTSLPSNSVLNFFEDGEKNFWIGTQTGMARLTRTQVSIVPLPRANDADFETIYGDRDGSFWIGSTLLFQMKDGALKQRTLPGMRGVHVRNIFRDLSGVLWAGTDGDGIYRIAAGRTTRWTTRDGLTNNFIRAIAQDHDRSMWIGTDSGLNHLVGDSEHPRIVSYQPQDGLAYYGIRRLLEDRRGDLWIGTDRGLSHMHGGAFIQDAATAELAQMKVFGIHEDADSGLWFGTRNNGLFRLRDGRVSHFAAKDGLAGNAIYNIVEDAEAHLWMSGPNGISLLNRHELDAQAELPTRHLALTFYPISEMAANTEIYGGTDPSGFITAQGDVWFPSNRGPIHILPLQRTLLPPPLLRVDTVLADGRPVSAAGPIVLQPGNSRLEFAFTPIRLRSQAGLRFRYMLDRFDRDWSTATSARTADYTNLPPGRYRFRVQTFEVGDPGAVSEASIEIVQRPFFYRTWWFIAACAMLAGLLIYGVYQYRVRQVRTRFEAILGERSRLAREMHDTVIQGCTGVSALLEAISMEIPVESAGDSLMDFARLQLRTTINEARDAVWDLRQPDCDTTDLGAKLESMAGEASAEFNLPVVCLIKEARAGVSHPLAHDLLMVAREAVYNAVLHGSPTHVEVAFTCNRRELTLSVVDDGCGFDVREMESQNGRHFGLKGMKERVERCGGKLRLTSALGKGVRIEARLPLHR